MDKRAQLRELANHQGGYFTARQAASIGYDLTNANYYIENGDWTREAHGIYRLSGVPSTDPNRDELHFWLLWTIGRKAEAPRGVLAYETVFSVFGLSDLIPSRIHLAVPKTFKVSKLPKRVFLHHEDRLEDDIMTFEGLRVIRPLRATIDLLSEDRISPEHIRQGFKDGLKKGVERSR